MTFYDICQVIMIYMFNFYNAICQLYPNKTEEKKVKLKILYERLRVNTDFNLPWATLTHEHKIVSIIYHGIEYPTNSIESRLTWNFIWYNYKSIGKLQYL